VYFGSSAPQLGAKRRSLLATVATAEADIDEDDRRWLFKGVPRDVDGLPDNLSPADWRQLRASIRTAAVDAVRALDRIENNSSLVLLLEVAGRRLLFAGDVESESWNAMYGEVKQQLHSVDFLKLSHHGRLDAGPTGLLDDLLPIRRKNLATVIVSNLGSVPGAQYSVQHDEILHNLKQRCRKLISVDADQALFVDVTL
jgi:hypothetical protein